MEIKEILDKLDSKIFPEDIKKELVESFTSAVNEKIGELTTKLETEYIDKEIAMEKKYTGKIEKFYESERSHISEYLTDLEKKLNESLITKYADEVLVEDALAMYRRMHNFISESSTKLNITPKQIDESEKSNGKIDSLTVERDQIQAKYNKFAKFSLIKEHHDTITSPTIREQFEKLADEIDFDGNVSNFNRKLERVRTNLDATYTNIVESVKKEVKPVIVEAKEPTVDPKIAEKNDRLKALKESIKNKSSRPARLDLIVESEQTSSDDFDDVNVY
jgi:hypothetical protein